MAVLDAKLLAIITADTTTVFSPFCLFVLMLWYRSYQTVTLLGLWLIPLVTSVHLIFWRMVLVWTLFSVITAFVVFKATRKKISVYTPR